MRRKMRTAIVQKNLALLMNDGEGSLREALRRSPESLGGNAGSYRGKSCFGANFYYERTTGEIVYFGNSEDVPNALKRRYRPGSLRMIFPKEYIVELVLEDEIEEMVNRRMGIGKPSQEAKRTLEETIQAWNGLRDTHKLVREINRYEDIEEIATALKKVIDDM